MERTVKVIRVNNPLESKYVTPAAVQYLDPKKWRLAEPKPEEAKKKDVESAVIKRVVPSNVTEIQPEDVKEEVKIEIPQEAIDTALSFYGETKAQSEDDFGKVDPKEYLRAEYKDKSGKDPDGRWNEARLKIEISKLDKQ